MQKQYNYYCSAVVRDSYMEHEVTAVSERQAWYKFCLVYGFKIRDFKVIGTTNIKSSIAEQIAFNI